MKIFRMIYRIAFRIINWEKRLDAKIVKFKNKVLLSCELIPIDIVTCFNYVFIHVHNSLNHILLVAQTHFLTANNKITQSDSSFQGANSNS